MDNSLFDDVSEQTWGPDDEKKEMTSEEFALSIWINPETWNSLLYDQLYWVYEKVRNKVKSLTTQNNKNYM